ncbi:MAG: EamA family transporter [Actinobacteria bacterium]|nr:EamA family transporter [Actinomycetota bacterium]
MSAGAPSALDRFSPEALFVVSGIAQYTGAVIAVSMFDEVAPASVAWIRVTGAALVLLALSYRTRRPWTRAELGAAALFGIASAVMNLCFYLAIDRIDLGKSVVIEFIGPIAVAAAFTRTRRNAVALGLAIAGVVALSGVEIDAEPLGLAFVFGASVMWAAYIVIGRRVAQLDRGVAGLGVGLGIGAVAIAPIGLPSSGPLWSSAGLLASGLLVGVLSNAVGYGIDQHVLRRIPVRRFALLLALLPVTAMIVGFIALDQAPSVIDALGAALVIAGVVVQERDELATVEAETTPA